MKASSIQFPVRPDIDCSCGFRPVSTVSTETPFAVLYYNNLLICTGIGWSIGLAIFPPPVLTAHSAHLLTCCITSPYMYMPSHHQCLVYWKLCLSMLNENDATIFYTYWLPHVLPCQHDDTNELQIGWPTASGALPVVLVWSSTSELYSIYIFSVEISLSRKQTGKAGESSWLSEAWSTKPGHVVLAQSTGASVVVLHLECGRCESHTLGVGD